MFSKIILLIITCYQTSIAIPIAKINNAIFDPIDANTYLTNLSNIVSYNICICQCYQTSACITVNYYGLYQLCVLFAASLQEGQLRVMSISEDSIVISLTNQNDMINTTMYNSDYTTVATTSNTFPLPATTSNYVCDVSTGYIAAYTTSPKTNYQKQIFYYTAVSTGTAILEFGLKAKNPSFTWHLDDVSIKDMNSSNAEKLINGNFENGTAIGWQIQCSSQNCGTTGGKVVTTSCHTGSYCYEGTCREAYDFLQQEFSIIIGHVYILTFWLFTDGHNAQAAYVNIKDNLGLSFPSINI